MENTHKKWQILNNFGLKIIALVTMTIDHLGIFLAEMFLTYNDPLVLAFRSIGRLALPLFAFMIYEGVKHTKHFGKYILRLGIMSTAVSLGLLVLHFEDFGLTGISYAGNIFLDLLLAALAAYLLKKEKVWLKLLSLLPLAYGILNFAINAYEGSHGGIVNWLPDVIRLQYGFYAIGIVMLLTLGGFIKNELLKSYATKIGAEENSFIGTSFDTTLETIINVTMITIASLSLFIIKLLIGYIFMSVQTYCLLAGVFVLLYNGKRGYNKKWFSLGCYLYYPLHLGILALIFYLITL